MFTGHREVKSMSMVVLPDLSMVTFKGWVVSTLDDPTDPTKQKQGQGTSAETETGPTGIGRETGSRSSRPVLPPRDFETSALGLGILHCNNLRSNSLYEETITSLLRREREHLLGPDGPDLLKALWLIWDGQVNREKGEGGVVYVIIIIIVID